MFPHTIGEEKSSPGKKKEAFSAPCSPSSTHRVPSVEATATRVLAPQGVPSKTKGLEYTLPVVWKRQSNDPLAGLMQYTEQSWDPQKTAWQAGDNDNVVQPSYAPDLGPGSADGDSEVRHGDEKTGPSVRNSHN